MFTAGRNIAKLDGSGTILYDEMYTVGIVLSDFWKATDLVSMRKVLERRGRVSLAPFFYRGVWIVFK